jgi:hypothetical protein
MFDSRKKLTSNRDEFEENRKHDIVGQVYEQRIRMDEIKQFAKNVVPKSRFIFDSYKVQTRTQTDGSQSDFSDTEMEEPIDEMQSALEKININKLAQRQKEEKAEEDYFSFFSSSEKVLMEPGQSFLGIRDYME